MFSRLKWWMDHLTQMTVLRNCSYFANVNFPAILNIENGPNYQFFISLNSLFTRLYETLRHWCPYWYYSIAEFPAMSIPHRHVTICSLKHRFDYNIEWFNSLYRFITMKWKSPELLLPQQPMKCSLFQK